MLDLAGIWALSDETGDYCCDMALPGDGITALHTAGLIPDPYFGRNEYGLRWISERDWSLTRVFEVDRVDQVLVIDMLDTVAEVFVNDRSVLQADTMFRTHRVDLSGALKVGRNEITLRFASPVRVGAERQAAMPFYIPYSTDNCPIPNGNMIRKPACDFGWDWNIALAPFGVYGDIRLEPLARPLISDLTISQSYADGIVTISIGLRAEAAVCQTLTVTCAGVSEQIRVNATQITAELRIINPDLWWPAGQGAQPLHNLTIQSGETTLIRRIGLRGIDLITEKDAIGTGFKFRVNGRDVFAKGANWIPQDALASNITPEATRDLLQSAVDANMNMIRVWGGGRYEPDWFYDICDELGLMVWQDFMFACNLYPSTPDFLAEVGREVAEQVARLHHHACIALWCGDNELIGALTWFSESRNNRDRYLVSYDRLNRTIEAGVKAHASHGNWWPSSPSPGPMSFGDAWHDDKNGDMHFWSVWHEGKDFDHYRDVNPRFCSEFGFQSYPSIDVIRRFANPADFNIGSPVMESHQKNRGGNARIAETMFRYFRFPVGFENFVYLSQIQQGLAIKTAVSYWRSLKPHCMGALYWQLNDTWPVCSWSSLDHGRGWKLLHHMARAFYAPVHVTIVPVDGGHELRAVNDTGVPVQVTIGVSAVTMAGHTRALARPTTTIGPDAAVTVMLLDATQIKPDEMFTYVWLDSNGVRLGSDIFAPKPWKTYDLEAPGLTQTVVQTDTGWQISLTAKTLALFVAIEADQPGRFSANALTLLPDQPTQIEFLPSTPGNTPVFTLRDLHSATYGIV